MESKTKNLRETSLFLIFCNKNSGSTRQLALLEFLVGCSFG